MSKLLPWPVALLLLATTALAIDITTPGQTVPRGQVGVLQADLSCTPSAIGVFLDNGATLAMNGHVLDGCGVAPAVLSRVRIRVLGPGLITHAGIVIRSGTLVVRDVDVQDANGVGINGTPDALDGPSTLRLRDVTVTGSSQAGIWGTKVIARNVVSSGNGVDAPGDGIVGGAGVKGHNLVVSGNSAEGISAWAGNVVLRDSQVTGNALGGVYGFGISRGALTLVRSTVTGNDAQGGVDLASQRPPRLRDSTCGSSLDSQQMVPWGVCAND